jgi:hypothetical protein
MELNSPVHNINKSPQEVFSFLSNVSNFESIMPENNKVFKVIDENRFAFALKGMPEIVLEITERIESERVTLGSTNPQFPFSLKANIQAIDTGCTLQLNFEGEFNAMISMMIKAPLTHFIESLSEKAANHFNA